MANLLFYKTPVALNKVAHKDTRIKPLNNDFGFARDTNSVIVAGVEFSEAAKDYPIVFAQAGEGIVPVALLGLRNAENLFVKPDGSWDARYIPAFVRRYPFVLAETGQGQEQRVVCIDEGFAGFNQADGELLFENEEPTPMLKQAIDFLEEYQKQYLRTEAFLKRLQELDLLVSLNAKVDLVSGEQFSLTGLMAVDEKKLLGLSDELALQFFKSGELGWVYCHLMSLGNLGGMVNRVAGVPKADDAAPEVAVEPKATKAPKAKKTQTTS
jgi:hypothetical protein